MSLVLLLSRGAMELCWLAAWSMLTLAMVTDRHYPLVTALGVFVNAAALTRFCSGHRLRFRAPLQAAGGALLVLYTVHGVVAPGETFANLFWIAEVAKHPPSVTAWRVAAAFSVWTVALWVAGCHFAVRSDAYLAVCARFDRGLLWLFALLLVKLLLRNQQGVWQTEDGSDAMILPYFVFGLTAIALARNRSDARRRFLRGRRGVGVLVAFAGLVMALGVGGTLLSLPYLHSASEVGYDKLAAFAGPFGPILAELIVFLMKARMSLPLPNKKPLVPVGHSVATRGGRGATTAALSGASTFWLVVSVLLLACVVAWAVYRWRAAPRGERAWFAGWRAWLNALLRGWYARWQRYLARRRQDEAIRIYRALRVWGHRSGLDARASETPLEYGRRLQLQVHGVGAEVDRIVALFNERMYGETLDRDAVAAARRALRRLRSPRLWPRRMATWLANDANEPRAAELSR